MTSIQGSIVAEGELDGVIFGVVDADGDDVGVVPTGIAEGEALGISVGTMVGMIVSTGVGVGAELKFFVYKKQPARAIIATKRIIKAITKIGEPFLEPVSTGTVFAG